MATYVLVHGAFTGGWVWTKVAEPLRAAGHIVHTPTLEGCAERYPRIRPGITIDTHVQELIGYLFYHDLKDVVLVGTSISGLAISMVADKVPERVGRLVYIDALLPLPGESLRDILVPIPGAKWETTELALGPARELIEGPMFEDLDPEFRAWVAARFTLHPIGGSPRKGPDMEVFWKRKWKATVINGSRGSNPSEAHQRRTAEKLNADYLEIDCGHYPHLSKPQELAQMLMRE
ncbi:MAG: alpha/beta hydrolase [Deltaproteobacteria bacterium]|nr:alpha/beta hydrolase [Deltaproteobacteria bacterium]